MSTSDSQNRPRTALIASNEPVSIGEYVRNYWQRLRGGDLGPLPIIIGLLLITLIFASQNSNFLSPRNFVNLILQMAGTTMIAYGLVYILLLGEIDLSVGYVSAVAGVGVVVLLLPASRQPQGAAELISVLAGIGIFGIGYLVRPPQVLGLARQIWLGASLLLAIIIPVLLLSQLGVLKESTGGTLPWFIALAVGLLAAAGIGMVQGTIITAFQVPSFVVTLSGLLAWNGVVLLIIGQGGTVILQDKTILGLAKFYFDLPTTLLIFGVLIGVFTLLQLYTRAQRGSKGLSVTPVIVTVIQIAFLVAVVGIVCWIVFQDRGMPLVGVLMIAFLIALTFLAENTRFGRYVYAIGGNKEAARRAGIRVQQIRVAVFCLAAFMAGVGGVILAARLSSVATGQGGGNLLLNAIASAVIGGTSLFGGRGKIYSALLGALIISAIENGMSLLGLDAAAQFIVTGLVLLVAVILDSFSRRSQSRSGIA